MLTCLFEASPNCAIFSTKKKLNASTSEDVARALGMSRRTLYRRLQDHGTRCNKLREEMINDTAKTSLLHASAPITQIAMEPGYSEASAFNRLFRRLTGTTPAGYRKSYNADQTIT